MLEQEYKNIVYPIEQNSPALKVILTTTADMVSTLTSIISNGVTAEQFREKYMQADVLL